MKAGGACHAGLKIPFPMLVDEMDNRVENVYRAWPIRATSSTRTGGSRSKTRAGPFGFQVDEVRPARQRVVGPSA
jgi:hypothetical protein